MAKSTYEEYGRRYYLKHKKQISKLAHFRYLAHKDKLVTLENVYQELVKNYEHTIEELPYMQLRALVDALNNYTSKIPQD